MKILEEFTDRKRLKQEMSNFEEMASYLKPLPGEIPQLEGIDIYGTILPLTDSIGGDHIIYADFKKRYDLDARIKRAEEQGQYAIIEKLKSNKKKAGILISDVSGHSTTDYFLNGLLHQAFLMGALYELDTKGEITTQLFENINTRFYNTSAINKYLTLVYGEISEEGHFRFISAGHPHPKVFSSKMDMLVDINENSLARYPPVGFMPSIDDIDKTRNVINISKEPYLKNDLTLLGTGDMILLYSDGLSEHGNDSYFPDYMENVLIRNKHLSAEEITNSLIDNLKAYAPPEDDISIVVIKKLG